MKPLNSYSLAQAQKAAALLTHLLAGNSIRGNIPANFNTKKAA